MYRPTNGEREHVEREHDVLLTIEVAEHELKGDIGYARDEYQRFLQVGGTQTRTFLTSLLPRDFWRTESKPSPSVSI
jgi:hypothetical protein